MFGDFISKMIDREHRSMFTGEKIEELEGTETDILINSMQVYGSIFVFLTALFCILRYHFPKYFNIRSWAPGLKCDLAVSCREFGYFDWAWKLYRVSDDDIRQQCGMDALTYLRALRFGFYVSTVGIFNSIWLLAVYGTAEESEETADVTDGVVELSVSHVPPGSFRFLATVFAAYIQFGYTMYLIHREFAWFTRHRHLYLSERKARNYTVYVSGIPSVYRSDHKLKLFFEKIFMPGAVMECRVAINMPHLKSKVTARDAVIQKLEHAHYVEKVKGIRPMHLNVSSVSKGENMQVDSIDFYTQQLNELNTEIAELIRKVKLSSRPNLIENGSLETGKSTLTHMVDSIRTESFSTLQSSRNFGVRKRSSLSSVGEDDSIAENEESSFGKTLRVRTPNIHAATETVSHAMDHGKGLAKKTFKTAGHFATESLRTAGAVATTAMGVKLGGNGVPTESGFVTFNRLSTTQAALQMVHHATPFRLKLLPAPDARDIYWQNIGATNKAKQIGKLISYGLTITLCIFWTIPVTFIKTLTEVENLKKQIEGLEEAIDKAPFLEMLLALIAPLIILTLTLGILPAILEVISRLEGPISLGVLESAVFVKMSVFMVIQTFFVSTVSGTLLETLSDPNSALDALANSLPKQATYFLQIIVVRATVLGLSMELLRVVPFAAAVGRQFLGPNLTEKERNQPFLGFFRPLSNPYRFRYAIDFSLNILYFMVIFVYSTMAPLVNWYLAAVFLLMEPGFRYQFICNYPPGYDSGGVLFVSFIQIMQVCMILAQVTLLGFLILKKALGAGPFLIPLIVMSVLFTFYLKQEHYKVPQYLTSEECISKDMETNDLLEKMGEENNQNEVLFDLGEYIQPELKAGEPLSPETFEYLSPKAEDPERAMTKLEEGEEQPKSRNLEDVKEVDEEEEG